MNQEEQFLRAEMLLGKEAIEILHRSHVAVFGLGGVGSWCAESLARMGIGHLTLIDSDEYAISNINRQSQALHSTVGHAKADVMAARVRDINPAIEVIPLVGTYNAQTREQFFVGSYDYVADCIDLVSCKLDLILTCRERSIPILSALGTGNKKDASQLQLTDISKTYGDALARVMRKELRARGVEHHAVVFSPEEPMKPSQPETPPPGRRSVPGSLVWVPASAGLLMTQHIVTELIARSAQ